MDTKQRTRSEDAQRRRKAEQAAKTGQKKRSAAAQPQKRRSAAGAKQTAQTTRSKNQTQQRRQNPQERQRTAAQERPRQPRPEQPRQSVPTPDMANQAAYAPVDLKEEVFRPDQQARTAAPRDPAAAKRAEQRRKSAQRAQERKKQAEKAKHRPNVVYTQPKPLNLNRLLLQLAVVLAVVLAITAGLSVFFRVEKVVVYGNNAYSAWTIQEASGIETGEKLLSLGNTRASGKIIANLPYVEKVRIGIKLPDTVNIYVTEYDVVYSVQDQDGNWWLMTSGGKAVEAIDGGTAGSYTKVQGVQISNPIAGQKVKAVEEVQVVTDATDAAGETVATTPVVVTGASRLDAALQILQALETNDIVGEIASVDVSSLANIEMWYGQRFQVKVGDTSQLNRKVYFMKRAVSQRSDYEMGILDVSFTTWPDQVGYTPLD